MLLCRWPRPTGGHCCSLFVVVVRAEAVGCARALVAAVRPGSCFPR